MKQVDIAVVLEPDADKLPDLHFSKTGDPVIEQPKPADDKPAAKPPNTTA